MPKQRPYSTRTITGGAPPVAGFPWTGVPITAGEARRIAATGDPSTVFSRPASMSAASNIPFAPPALLAHGGRPVPAVPWSNVPLSREQAMAIVRTGDPRAGLGAPAPLPSSLQGQSADELLSAGPVLPGSGFLKSPVDPTTLLPTSRVLTGGSPVAGFPWKTEQIPMSMAPPPMQAVEPVENPPPPVGDPVMPGQPIMPPALPEPTLSEPGMDGNPENIGEITVTPPDQLKGFPWTSIEIPADQPPPPFMNHVIMDPGLLNPIRSIPSMQPGGGNATQDIPASPPPVPDVAWTSDILRVGILPPPVAFAMR